MVGRRMKRLLLALLIFWPRLSAQQAFTPPEVASAGDAYALYNIASDGLFIAEIEIGDDGSIRGVETLRNPGGMLGTSESAIRNWKFQPACKGGKARASRMTVAFVCRPANYPTFGAVPPKDFAPVIPSGRTESSGDYVPIGVLSFAYPDYPINSATWGSVLLQATVDSGGNVTNVDTLHGLANFDRFAHAALKNWRFRAAAIRGVPVKSKITIAFIFQSPQSSN